MTHSDFILSYRQFKCHMCLKMQRKEIYLHLCVLFLSKPSYRQLFIFLAKSISIYCVFIFTIYQNRNLDLEMLTLKPENLDRKNNTVFLNFVQQFRRLKTITHKRSCHGFQFLLWYVNWVEGYVIIWQFLLISNFRTIYARIHNLTSLR